MNGVNVISLQRERGTRGSRRINGGGELQRDLQRKTVPTLADLSRANESPPC